MKLNKLRLFHKPENKEEILRSSVVRLNQLKEMKAIEQSHLVDEHDPKTLLSINSLIEFFDKDINRFNDRIDRLIKENPELKAIRDTLD